MRLSSSEVRVSNRNGIRIDIIHIDVIQITSHFFPSDCVHNKSCIVFRLSVCLLCCQLVLSAVLQTMRIEQHVEFVSKTAH